MIENGVEKAMVSTGFQKRLAEETVERIWSRYPTSPGQRR